MRQESASDVRNRIPNGESEMQSRSRAKRFSKGLSFVFSAGLLTGGLLLGASSALANHIAGHPTPISVGDCMQTIYTNSSTTAFERDLSYFVAMASYFWDCWARF